MSKKIKQNVIIIVVTAVIFFILGIAIPSGGTIIKDTTSEFGSFQEGWDAAEQRLIETGFVPMMGEEMEIMSVSGDVQDIKGNKITLKIYPLSPLADKNLDVRIIDVSNANFYRLIEKDQAQFQKEMEDFDKKMTTRMESSDTMAGATLDLITPPEMFIKQIISSSELKVGQQIMVTAGEDIKDAKQFDAEEVVVQSMLEGLGEMSPLVDEELPIE